MKANHQPHCDVYLVHDPSDVALQAYWQARQSDPLVPVFYADTGPQTFDAFKHTIETGGYLFRLALRDEQIVGAIWLHDIERDTQGEMTDAWLGGYVLPGVRGRHVLREMWDLFRPECEALGLRHFHGGTRSDNEIGYHIGHSQLDMIDVGIFPKFASFNGEYHDCYIFTLHPQDKERVWRLAHKRWLKAQQAAAL